MEKLNVKKDEVKKEKSKELNKITNNKKKPVKNDKPQVKKDSKQDSKKKVESKSLFSIKPEMKNRKYFQLSRDEKLRYLRSLCKGNKSVLGWYHLGLKQLLDECLRNNLVKEEFVAEPVKSEATK
ncbi:hypothetical protein KA977_15590 [Candidatus Dependentiae bacterium]|nr:hypothetical protein [Candidatus Dependentiae bacterium]